MSDSIQVAIKVRPLIKREKDESLQLQWTVVDNAIVPVDAEKKRGEGGFQFDHIFDIDKTNNDVFEIVKPIVDAAVKGFNGTVFAYGQTSSGKTYTMLGSVSEPGIIPMAVDRMFDSIAETNGREFLLRVSYLEIYNEKVNDLLDTSGIDLKLREDNNGLVQVLKCKEEIATSPEVIMSIMKKGDKNRRIGETDMNEKSSRSHSIFRITIESRDMSSDSDGAIQVSQLNLVDLAGSERARQTNATGERFKEGTHINMSLSTLGLVIKQLSESDTNKYINFRDSKLTRLLQASLGGNAMTTIICAVTPVAFEETQCTLWFASRAKSVKNKPQLNEVMSDAALLKRYKKQLTKLNEELSRLKQESRIAEVEEMESKLQEKEHKLQETDRLNQLLEERIQLLKNGIISADNASKYDNNTKITKSKRRRTWAGDRGLSTRLSCPLKLPTIKEVSCTSPESKSNCSEQPTNVRSRKSIIQTVNFNDESFETAFTDFELELIKMAKEREEETDSTNDFTEEKDLWKVKPKSENRVKFQENVEICRFSCGSNYSEITTPEKLRPNSNIGDINVESPGSPGTPKAILRERLNYLTEEYNALQEFTTLERQTLCAQQLDFDSPTEKIFMQKQVDELLKRLQQYSKYQTDLEEQLTVSLNCINELCSRTPDILDLWKPLLCRNEKGEINTYNELKKLQESLEHLKSNQNNSEKVLTPLEKKLTNEYNESLLELEQVRSQKELLFAENTELKKKLIDESNKLKSTNTLVNTLRTDTDCLMEKLIQKNSELAKLKERIVDLEQDMQKSICVDSIDLLTKKKSEVDPTTNLNSGFDNQHLDSQVSKLNEIIEEKTMELIKYRQFEEEMKMENEHLQQSLDALTKDIEEYKKQAEMAHKHTNISSFINKEESLSAINCQQFETDKRKLNDNVQLCSNIQNKAEKVSQDCQTDFILNYNENNVETEITRLSKIINENAVTIKNYKQLEKEMKNKIEELQQYIDSTIQSEKTSEKCSIESEAKWNDNNKVEDPDKNAEISKLLNIIQEKVLDISSYQKREIELKDNIQELQQNLGDIIENKNIFQECPADYIDSNKQSNIEVQNKESEISKLLEIIKEKNMFIENYEQKEKQMKEEITHLKNTVNTIGLNKQSSKECRTSYISTDEKESENNINFEKNIEFTNLKNMLDEKTSEIIKYMKSEEELKKEIERLQLYLNNANEIEKTSSECQIEDMPDVNGIDKSATNLYQDKSNEISGLIEIIQLKSAELEKSKRSEEDMRKQIEQLQLCLANEEKVEQTSDSDQIEQFTKKCNNSCIKENKISEVSMQSEITNGTSLEIEEYKITVDKMEKEIVRLQYCLEGVKNTQTISVECQTEHISNTAEECAMKVKQDKDIEIMVKSKIIEQSLLENEMCNYNKNETKNKIERSSLESQSEHLFDNEKDTDSNLIQVKDEEISSLLVTIQNKELMISQYKHTEEEARKEIERLQQCLENATKAELLSKDCQTEFDFIFEEHNTDISLVKDNKISELNSIIQEQIIEIIKLKQIEEKGIEISNLSEYLDNVTKVEKVSREIQTEELVAHGNTKISNQLEISSQEDKASKLCLEISKDDPVKTNMDLEIKIKLLNDELVSKTKYIEELSSLNSALRNEINEKSIEISNLQQTMEIKVKELQEKINVIILERNELQEKIDSVYCNKLIDFENEITNLKEIVQKLKQENDIFNNRIQEYEAEQNKNNFSTLENSLLTTTPDKFNKIMTKEIINNSVKIVIEQLEEKRQSVSCVTVEQDIVPALQENFIKPSSIAKCHSKDITSAPIESNKSIATNNKTFVKPVNKKFDLESSSVFANMTYFDNMETSQSFIQDCTSLLTGLDESKNLLNISTNPEISVVNNLTVHEPVLNISKMESENINISKSENLEAASYSCLENKSNVPLTIEELEKIKTTLEKENVRLSYDLQKKIQETEEVKKEVRDFKQALGQLQQTMNENMDMSKQLTEARENNNEIANHFQKEIDLLTARLSVITDEKLSLQNELTVLQEEFDNMRAATPVITDEEIKQKLLDYQEKLKALTDENIELSTNLIEKIEELEKVKESKIQVYDHECIYKEKLESLTEEMQCLNKENIALSNGLTEQIEENDKLKDTIAVSKQQLEAYANQYSIEHSDQDIEFFKHENTRLMNELIELKATLTQVISENANLSINLVLDNSDEHNKSTNEKTALSNTVLQTTIAEENSVEINNASLLNSRVKNLQEQVDHLTLLNKKLGELKLTNCTQCANLKELNESRRKLKLEVKSLNQKLGELQKKFEQKCADTEFLRTKANEDFNASISLLDSTLNGSFCDGVNVTIVEEKVQKLHCELEELKESHNKLSSQYKEKCNELEKLQIDNTDEEKENRRSKSDSTSRKNSVRIQNLQKDLDKLSNELQELKKSNTKVSNTLNNFMTERNKMTQEIESLKLVNEELKKESNSACNNILNYEEKVKLMEEEIATLYKQIEIANTVEKEMQTHKLEIEVQLESILKEKSELINSLNSVEEKLKKELDECKVCVSNYEKENFNLKNEIQKFEDIVQCLKGKNLDENKENLQEEIDSAKTRIIKEIRSLQCLSENDLKDLPKKSVTDIFMSFLNTILSKETEIVKKIQEEYEKSKRKLEEQKQQSIDAEKRANIWAKTLEGDLEKIQNDLTEQENKNQRLREQAYRLEEHLKETQHENQQLHINITNLEADLNSLHNELDTKSKTNIDRDCVIIAAQEKERLAKTKEEEWENRLKLEKEDHVRKIDELNAQLDSYKSLNEDLRSTVEGLDLEIEHLKNTIGIKTTECMASVRRIEELQKDIVEMEDIHQQLKNENLEKNKNVDEITGLLKIKCDLLTEYKTKVETLKPEYESLQAQIADRKICIEKYKEEIHNLKLDNQRQLDILNDKLSAEEIKSAGLNKQVAELKNKNTALSTTIEEFKDRCAELERDNTNLQRKVRNSTSKVRVESEMQELQDENRSLKNHLEGSYNRIKELQESKSQVQRELIEAQGKNELLEQELNTTKIALESLREKYNNVNLQKLREKYELLLREKNSIILDIENKKMLIANKDQKLVEYSIEMDTLRKQKEFLDKEIENINKEKSLLENRISDLLSNSEKMKEKIDICNAEKDSAYQLVVEEKSKISRELENCQKEMSELVIKNKELDEEMDDLVNHIHKQDSEIAELQDRLITGSFNGNLEKFKHLEEENDKLKIDLRVTEINRTTLQNEIVRLNSEKELLIGRIEDLNGKIAELELKNSSRSSSKSNSPTTQKGRRHRRRSEVYNQNRNIDIESDNREVTDTDSPSITPIPPIRPISEECSTCIDLRNQIREISLDLVSRNNKITMLEVQLQSENFPYQMKCNELQNNLLSLKTKNKEFKLEIQKLQRALMEDSSRECYVCRRKKLNKRDQAVQVNPENKICLTGMSSGIVEDHLRLEKMEKERNWMKDLCRSRARKIKELEERLRELEGLKCS